MPAIENTYSSLKPSQLKCVKDFRLFELEIGENLVLSKATQFFA